jgi:membrane protein required for colicin V production
VVLLILVIPAVTGLCKGFVRTVFGLLGMVGGIVLSIAFARPLGIYFSSLIGASDHFVGTIVAFIVIFFVCGVCGFLLAWLLRRMIRLANLGFLDRLAGGALGFLQGSAIAGVILIVLYLMPSSHSWIEESLISKKIVNISVAAIHSLPEEWTEYFSPKRWIGYSSSDIPEFLRQEPDDDTPTEQEEENAET